MAEKKVISNKGGKISILILGDISAWYGANSKALYDTLRNKDVQEIDLYISSDGGALTEALVMYDMLKGHKAKVKAHLTGMVASAATVLACACDEVEISKQAVYMIHRASAFSYGNATSMKKTAGILEMFDNKLVEIYSEFATMRKKDLRKKLLWELIENEYYTDQAGVLEMGLADRIVDYVEFDFDTEQMQWKFYTSAEKGVETEADPSNLANYGAYYSKLLHVKGYKYLSLNDIKSKLDMKSMKSVFASFISFLGVQGFLKDGVVDEATAAAERFEIDDDIENFVQAAAGEYLNSAKLIVAEIRTAMDQQIADLNARIDGLVETNKGVESLNKQLQMELNTEKETVKAFQVSIQQELAQVKNMKPVVSGNGESVANPVTPVAEGISDDEREFYGSAVQRGNITAEQYKSITGIDYQ